MSTAEYTAHLARRSVLREAIDGTAAVRESDLHDEIEAECRRRGWITIHARMDQASTIRVGAPDFVVLADGGRTYLIEAKSKTGKLTTEQAAFRAWAGKLGHTVVVIRSLEAFLEVTKS